MQNMKEERDDDDDEFSTNLNSFEFETSKKFGIYAQFEDMIHDEEKIKATTGTAGEHERGGSLPTMAFADELFSNGQVMPLKLPPRLQPYIVPTPPRSPTSFKLRRNVSWNDDFDPFVAALQSVKDDDEEMINRGRRSSGKQHRRSRSHSPFKNKVSPLMENKVPHEENNYKKSDSNKEKINQLDDESKGIKGILRRCATLWKENINGEEERLLSRKWSSISSSNYLKKLMKSKRVIGEPKMNNKRNKLTLPLCFYGIESPRIMR